MNPWLERLGMSFVMLLIGTSLLGALLFTAYLAYMVFVTRSLGILLLLLVVGGVLVGSVRGLLRYLRSPSRFEDGSV